jgi:hypothetical protein
MIKEKIPRPFGTDTHPTVVEFTDGSKIKEQLPWSGFEDKN